MILPIRKDLDNDPILRCQVREIKELTPELKKLIKDMAETMYSARGVGLAAPQVGEPLAIIVYDASKEKNNCQALINPKITWKSSELMQGLEACLSVPGREGEVLRHQKVCVQAMDQNGKPVTYEVEGLMSKLFQHEIDHLHGRLYTDLVIPGTLKPSENFDV
jgi:peptide deformylase